MNYYETLYVVHSALEAGRLKDTILNIENTLKDNGGKPIGTEIWGKKKLSYLIEKQKYGTYVLVQYESDGTKNNNFNIELEHNPSVLAYMTVRIEKNEINKECQDIDTQIEGKNPTSSDDDKKNNPIKNEDDSTENKNNDPIKNEDDSAENKKDEKEMEA